MKKISLVGLIMTITISFSFAQSSKVMAAYNYLEEYKLGRDGKDLVEAKEAIDIATKHETTGVQGKTWYYKGMIYQLLAKDSLLSQTDKTYMATALESFEKSVTLNDKKFRNSDDALTYMKSISADIFNRGVEAYQNRNFEQAYADFYAMKAINEVLTKNDVDLVVPTERTVSNTAAAAEQGGMIPEAIAAYKDLLTYNNEVNNYRFLADLYKKSGDKEAALKTLDEAAAAHPENAEIEEVHTEELVEESVVNNELESLTQDLEATNVSASENATPTNSNTENPANEVEEVVEVPDPGPTVNENALFEGSNSSNQGTGNNPGDQGNPNGNLESDIYGDIAGSGFGGAGDGASLNGRGLVSRPTFSNPTNQFGKVVIKITVNKSGKVVKAELVSLYSTNTNQALVNYAISEAYKFKFNNVSSDTKARDNQVGKIIYNFTAN